MATHETQIIRSLDEVPAGYVQLAWFKDGVTVPGRSWKTIVKFMSESHARGLIPAVKLIRAYGDIKTGPVFACKKKAVELLRETYGMVIVEGEPTPTPVPASIPMGSHADLVLDALKQLIQDHSASSLQSRATLKVTLDAVDKLAAGVRSDVRQTLQAVDRVLDSHKEIKAAADAVVSAAADLRAAAELIAERPTQHSSVPHTNGRATTNGVA